MRPTSVPLAPLAVLLLLVNAATVVGQQAITGQRLVIRDSVAESRNRVVFESRDPAIQIAAPRSPDDPTCRGDRPGTVKATIGLSSPTTGQLVVYPLPCQNWRVIGNPRDPAGYRYRDPEQDQGPCRVVQVRRGRLIRAYCSGRPGRFDLVRRRSAIPMGVQFASGALRQCAEFAKTNVVKRQDGSDGRRFRARGAPAPSLCACDVQFVEAKVDGVAGVKGLRGPTDVMVSPDGANVYVASLLGSTIAGFKRAPNTGKLTFLEAKVNDTGGVKGLAGAIGIASSPDGNHLYVTAFYGNALGVFSRKPTTGRLTFVEVKADGQQGVDGLDGATGVAVSPDGKHVYATGQNDNAIAVFARNPSNGKLTFVEAKANGRDGVQKLASPNSVAVSPDGAHVYVTALNDSAVDVFARDAATGRLTLIQTLNDSDGVSGLKGVNGVAISQNGSHVYVGSFGDDSLVAFTRDPTTGQLAYVGKVVNGTDGVTGLDNPSRPVLSGDGACLYVGAFKSADVAIFARAAQGVPHFLGIRANGQDGVTGLDGAAYGAVSPDGRHVYFVGQKSNALVLFRREPAAATPPGSSKTGSARR